MNDIEKNNLWMIFLLGMIFIVLGIKTLVSPVFWFKVQVESMGSGLDNLITTGT